jgi:hypothetical protein
MNSYLVITVLDLINSIKLHQIDKKCFKSKSDLIYAYINPIQRGTNPGMLTHTEVVDQHLKQGYPASDC